MWLGGFTLLWIMPNNPQHFASDLIAGYLLFWGFLFLLSKQSSAERANQFVLAGLSIFLVLVGLELFALAKLVDYRSVFSTPIFAPWRNPRYLLDPELIHIRRPYEHLTGTSRGGDIAWLFDIPSPQLYQYDAKYDHNGFRNDHDLEKADIAVIGDSFIEEVKVPSSSLMTSVLGLLQQGVVANLAQIGYGPPHELAVLKRYALPLCPRTIVWAFFEGNDLKNVTLYNEIAANWPAQSASFHSFIERSFTKNALLATRRLAGDPKPSAQKQSGIIKSLDGRSQRMYFLYPGAPLSSADLAALEQTHSILAEAHALCAAQRVHLVVVFVPTKFRVYNEIVEWEEDSPCNYWIVNDLPERLRKLVTEINDDIGYVDLTPRFKEMAKGGEVLYFLDDTHWSPAGHHVAAQAIHEYLGKHQNTQPPH